MSQFLSFIGWTFLPSFVTSWTLTILYRLFTRAGDPIPVRGTARYARDYRRLHILVVSLYLLYTIYEAYDVVRRTPTYYDLLGVPHSVDDRTLRQKFRRLSVQFHPDKAGPESSGVFVMLKHAYDTLANEVSRFGYDRFGPEIAEWRNVRTVGDYVRTGTQQLVPWYGGSAVVLVTLSVLGKFEMGRYWRFYALTFLLAIEAAVITTPYNFLERFAGLLPMKALLPFEQLIIARKVVLTSFIAFSQLGPLLVMSPTGGDKQAELNNTLERLHYISEVVENEAKKLLVQEVVPFDDDPEALKGLERKMGEWIVENQVRSDPEVQQAMGKAIARRRQNAPAGAKGTK